MKKIKYILMVLAMAVAANLMAQTHQYNNENTIIKWTGEKIGGTHYGNISLKEGFLKWDHDQIVSGVFVVDMKSITNTDLENESYNKKLVDHLISDDFFGADEYPEAKLELTKSAAFKDGKAMLSGNLTIRDKTHAVEFEAIKDAQELHEDLRNYGAIQDKDKPLIVSGILLALRETKYGGFSIDSLTGDTTTTDGEKIYNAIDNNLKRSNVSPTVKKDKLMSQFSIIKNSVQINEYNNIRRNYDNR